MVHPSHDRGFGRHAQKIVGAMRYYDGDDVGLLAHDLILVNDSDGG